MTTTWKEWEAAVKADAADLQTVAKWLERASVEQASALSVLVSITPAARERYASSVASIHATRDLEVERLRSLARLMLELIAAAKWLADPKREDVLRTVSIANPIEQEDASKALRKPAQRGLDKYRLLRRWHDDHGRIDRVIEGARLYQAKAR